MSESGHQHPEQADPSLILGKNTLRLLSIDDPAQIQVVNDWRPGGGETYISDFLVRKGEETRHLIAKACVKFFPKETMEEWLGRRSLLASHGVVVPDLLLVDGATIVEEFIPLSLKDAYRSAPGNDKQSIQKSFDFTYGQVRNLGFNPYSLHDIRSHGNDVVMIDFGEDLGPSGLHPATTLASSEAQFVKLVG